MQLNIGLTEHRPPGAMTWELPPWGHGLARGVFPLLISVADELTPIGTAFCISRTGIAASATHLVRELFRFEPRGEEILKAQELPSQYRLRHTGLGLLHTHWASDEIFQVNVWPVEGAYGAPPTDVLYLHPQFQREFSYLPLKLSFAVPPLGSRVFCVGYSDAVLPRGVLSRADLESGRIGDWFQHYRHKFLVTEARVMDVFTQGFARGFGGGACFAVDAELAAGQSGGPVFNDAGYVCGVISATVTSFLNRPASLISLFYPSLLTEITFGCQIGPMRFDATHCLIDLVDYGTVQTDSSEELATFVREHDRWSVGIMTRRSDSHAMFDDFSSLQSGIQARGETRKVFCYRRRVQKG